MKKIIQHSPGITTLGILFIIAVVFVGVVVAYPKSDDVSNPNIFTENNLSSEAFAGIATTSVMVLNSGPAWGVDAQEVTESSTASPTNVGVAVFWNGQASSSNLLDYWLLICDSNASPTANIGAPPTCGGSQWAVSPQTSNSVTATASRTTLAGDAESNAWFAFICDGDPTLPKCNVAYKQGSGNTATPFNVNHRPVFALFVDDSGTPKYPGQNVTWTTQASDSDTTGTQDFVNLFVCKTAAFTGSACTVDTYCTSGLVASDPSCNFGLESIKQDKDYEAYGYIIDSHGFEALGGQQAADSVMTVANASPSILAGDISLLDTDATGSLTLVTEFGTTSGFMVKFTVTDSNSCENASSGNEIATAAINVYRSGIGMGACLIDTDYNANNCYPVAVGSNTWNISCSQDGGSCMDSSDDSATWTCTFPLWYLADPTNGTSANDSIWWNENWRASVQVADDNGENNEWIAGTVGEEVADLLAYTLDTTAINYGSLEPGTQNPTLLASTQISAKGNVGMDQNLYGADMCPGYPSCSGSPIDTIFVNNEKFATSSVAYAAGTALSTLSQELEIDVLKTTLIATPEVKSTFWGISVPIAITVSGNYTGVNTIIGKKGEAQQWQ